MKKGDTIIIYGGRHYGCAHKVLEVNGRVITAYHIGTGDQITVHVCDCDRWGDVMKIRDRAKLISRSNRDMMRFCALRYRANRQAGNLGFMVTWLVYAAHHRRASAEYLAESLEAA